MSHFLRACPTFVWIYTGSYISAPGLVSRGFQGFVSHFWVLGVHLTVHLTSALYSLAGAGLRTLSYFSFSK